MAMHKRVEDTIPCIIRGVVSPHHTVRQERYENVFFSFQDFPSAHDKGIIISYHQTLMNISIILQSGKAGKPLYYVRFCWWQQEPFFACKVFLPNLENAVVWCISVMPIQVISSKAWPTES